MKYKSYKFWFIRRDDSGFITEAGINFFEGEFRGVVRKNIDTGLDETKNEYVRTKKLDKEDLKDLTPQIIERLNGTQSVRYTPEDFGSIKTDDELRIFLNQQLAKVKGREAIVEQKWLN